MNAHEHNIPLPKAWPQEDLNKMLKVIYQKHPFFAGKTLSPSHNIQETEYNAGRGRNLSPISQEVLYCDSEDLPLYINDITKLDDEYITPTIFRWRMENNK